MSYVSVHIIKTDGTIVTLDNVAYNSHAFHVSIWRHLAEKHIGAIGYPSDAEYDRLDASIAQLPPKEGIVLAATWDRCWFPWPWRAEVCAALRAATYAPTSAAVADLLASTAYHGADPRGFAFSTSVTSSWNCRAGDDIDSLHHIDESGTRCIRCDISNIRCAANTVRM